MVLDHSLTVADHPPKVLVTFPASARPAFLKPDDINLSSSFGTRGRPARFLHLRQIPFTRPGCNRGHRAAQAALGIEEDSGGEESS
jgi:hypothetical protein